MLGSPLGMFGAVYFEEPYIRSKLPTCEEFYNLFHPSDVVANRVEPLIKLYEYPETTAQSPAYPRKKSGSFFEVVRKDVSHL